MRLCLLLITFLSFNVFASPANKDTILSLIDVGSFKGKKSFYDKSYYLMNPKEQDEYLKRHRTNYPEVREEFLYEYSHESGGYTYSVFYSAFDKKCFLITQQSQRLVFADRCRIETSRCTRRSDVKLAECFEKYAEPACKDFKNSKDPEAHVIETKYCEKIYKVTISEEKK